MSFNQKTRLGVAKAALDQVILREHGLGAVRPAPRCARPFPSCVAPADGPVPSPMSISCFRPTAWGTSLWKLFRGVVDGDNRSLETSTAAPVTPTASNPNTDDPDDSGAAVFLSTALMPAGNDSLGVDDAPLTHLLEDVRIEAARLLGLEAQCRNTVAVLITGGGEGTGGHVPSASSTASTTFTGTRRSPRADLRHRHRTARGCRRGAAAIATNSGGR